MRLRGKLAIRAWNSYQNDRDRLALELFVKYHNDVISVEDARVEPNRQFLLTHENRAMNIIPTGGWTSLAPFR